MHCQKHQISEYKTIASKGNKGLGSYELLVTVFSSTDQPTHYLVLSVFLIKGTFFNMHYRFIASKLQVNNNNSLLTEAYLT